MKRKRGKMNRRGQFATGLRSSSNLPVLVKVISILCFVGAFLGLIHGIITLLSAQAVGKILTTVPLLGSIMPILFIAGAVVSLLVGLLISSTFLLGLLYIPSAVLTFFIGMGLWKGKNWARLTLLSLFCLGGLRIVFILFKIGKNDIGLILQGVLILLVVVYFLFSKKVKEAFS